MSLKTSGAKYCDNIRLIVISVAKQLSHTQHLKTQFKVEMKLFTKLLTGLSQILKNKYIKNKTLTNISI